MIPRAVSGRSSREHDVSAAPYRAILFDMDGVLVDTDRTVVAFWQRIARRYNRVLTEEQVRHHVYGRLADETLHVLFPNTTVPERDGILREMRASEESDTYQEIPGALDLLHGLRPAGVPLALVTSGEPEKVATVERQFDLQSVFDAHVTARDVRRGKPDPECYRQGAQRLGFPASVCIVFEDALSGVQAALAAGARCIGLASPERASLLRSAGVGDVIADFSRTELETQCVSGAPDHGAICLAGARGNLALWLQGKPRSYE